MAKTYLMFSSSFEIYSYHQITVPQVGDRCPVRLLVTVSTQNYMFLVLLEGVWQGIFQTYKIHFLGETIKISIIFENNVCYLELQYI